MSVASGFLGTVSRRCPVLMSPTTGSAAGTSGSKSRAYLSRLGMPSLLATAVSAAAPMLSVIPNHCNRQNWMGARAMTVVGSLTVSFAVLISPPPETLAVLVRLTALVATSTTTVMGGYPAPAAKLSERVQVSVPRSAVQPAPLMAVAVSPAGSVSTTLTVPTVAALPISVTVMV